MNKPNLKFDIINNKLTEFSYMYNEMVHQLQFPKYCYYDLQTNKFSNKVISVQDFA